MTKELKLGRRSEWFSFYDMVEGFETKFFLRGAEEDLDSVESVTYYYPEEYRRPRASPTIFGVDWEKVRNTCDDRSSGFSRGVIQDTDIKIEYDINYKDGRVEHKEYISDTYSRKEKRDRRQAVQLLDEELI